MPGGKGSVGPSGGQAESPRDPLSHKRKHSSARRISAGMPKAPSTEAHWVKATTNDGREHHPKPRCIMFLLGGVFPHVQSPPA